MKNQDQHRRRPGPVRERSAGAQPARRRPRVGTGATGDGCGCRRSPGTGPRERHWSRRGLAHWGRDHRGRHLRARGAPPPPGRGVALRDGVLHCRLAGTPHLGSRPALLSPHHPPHQAGRPSPRCARLSWSWLDRANRRSLKLRSRSPGVRVAPGLERRRAQGRDLPGDSAGL